MPEPGEPLIELIFDRLATDGVPPRSADVILGAVSGEDDLMAALAGRPTTLAAATRGGDNEPTAHVYLSAVTVSGFRGVGSERTLDISPGPGLTVVAGRNGSGKSSFAEAIELSLTGDSSRWADRHSIWRTGWRNLHTPQPCAITTALRLDGAATPIRVRRCWPAGAELDDAEVTVTGPDGRHAGLTGLGMQRALQLYRPFLTATDLGTLLSGTPSGLFDALGAILGLDALTDADKRLLSTARSLETTEKQVRAERTALATRLADVPDDRARRAAAVLATATPDLNRLDAILREPVDTEPDAAVAAGRTLRDLTITDPAEVARLASELRTAAAAVRSHDDTSTQAAVRVAELLRLAVDHHDETGDGRCPVCRTGTLDTTWRTTAVATLERLRTSTLVAHRATAQLAEATRRVRAAIALPEISPATAGQLPEVDLTRLSTALAHLRAAPIDPEMLAEHVAGAYPGVAAAVTEVRSRAAAWLDRRDSAWRHVSGDIERWLTAARVAERERAALVLVKEARTWLKRTGEDLRNERLAPFAEHAQRIWQQLRQDSNIELGRMTLAGSNTRRRIVLPVSVDGADNGNALGVMSQGELYALGLATFLPRSCAKESPFRFIVIDDPVQSLDLAKVDGLAQVLAELATQRQVIVFTHDNRLPEAIRNLELDAQIIEILRAENSVVALRPALDPVNRYLDDARAVALSTEIPPDVRAPVVAELCRSGLEAACHRTVWRHRLAKGDRHADIEDAITAARTVNQTFALAMFDNAHRGGQVLPGLNQRYGRWAGDAYQACRKGVHASQVDDLRQLVADCGRLAEALR